MSEAAARDQAHEERMQRLHVKQLRGMVREPSCPEKVGLLERRIAELERREALYERFVTMDDALEGCLDNALTREDNDQCARIYERRENARKALDWFNPTYQGGGGTIDAEAWRSESAAWYFDGPQDGGEG